MFIQNLTYHRKQVHRSVPHHRRNFSPVHHGYQTGLGCCVGRIPNLFFNVTRCLEYLSSGENLAGCADTVGRPFGSVLCK